MNVLDGTIEFLQDVLPNDASENMNNQEIEASGVVTEDLRGAAAGEGLDSAAATEAAEALQEMARDACPEKFDDG